MQQFVVKLASLFVIWSSLVSLQAAITPLVNHGDTWLYQKGTNAPQSDWKTATDGDLDSATWASGAGGFGYADNTGETALCQTLMTGMRSNYTTVYMRRQFTISSSVDTNLHLYLKVDFDDGFIAWLNGTHMTNRFVPGAPAEPAYGVASNGDHESSLGNSSPKAAEIYDLGTAASWLGSGTHTLAIIGLNNSLTSSDFITVTDLYMDEPPPPPTSSNIVSHGDAWYYHKGTNAPQSEWKTRTDDTLNAEWALGRGGFGYANTGGAETNNCGTIIDAYNRYSTIYTRRQFTISNALPSDKHVFLRMDFDDGFIAWLDGNYLTNRNVAGAPAEPGNTASASTDHESSLGNSGAQPAETYALGSASTLLAPGTHVLAIMGLNGGSGSSDFITVADLFIDNAPTPPVALTNVWRAADSPIVVSSSYTVSNLATLIIEPGTTLYMGAGASLTVANGGCLLAEGTAEAPIKFVRSNASAPNWGHIVINGSVGSPESRICHAYLEGNGSSPCIEVAAGSLTLDHASFGTTSRQYLALDGASFVVSDCYFPATTAGFEPLHGIQGIKQGGRGIFRNCFFGAISGYNDTIDFTGSRRPGPILQVYNCVFMGSGDDNLDLDTTDAWVEGNIFLHVHKNGSPDTSSGVSGGNDYGNGDVTIVRNIFYDVDQAAMCKQGNFYTLLNNTIVLQTHQGGLDTESAVVCLQDNNMTEGRGMYLEGNIMHDIEALVRNPLSSVNTFTNNLMPLAWSGPGGGNSTNNPMLTYIPQLAETYFTNWADAQIMKQWFTPQPGSPALGTGPNGVDIGATAPLGASISGEPVSPTTNTSATLVVGINRTGNSIPVSNWPNGSGYTHYKWRLDTNAWSAETSLTNPIVLNNLALGTHQVEVIGKNDAGYYQNNPELGANARVCVSRTWTVQAANLLRFANVELQTNACIMRFEGEAGKTYTIESSDSLRPANWQFFRSIPALPSGTTVEVIDSDVRPGTTRFYRIGTP